MIVLRLEPRVRSKPEDQWLKPLATMLFLSKAMLMPEVTSFGTKKGYIFASHNTLGGLNGRNRLFRLAVEEAEAYRAEPLLELGWKLRVALPH